MGEVVVSIQRSQATAYSNILRNEEVQRLILDSRFTKDDDVSMCMAGIFSFPMLLAGDSCTDPTPPSEEHHVLT